MINVTLSPPNEKVTSHVQRQWQTRGNYVAIGTLASSPG